MKLLLLLVIAACFVFSSAVNAQKITLSERNASLEKIFSSIEKQSGYLFWYEYPTLRQAKRITINVKDLPLREVLDICFKGQPLTYTIVNRTIVISKKKENESTAGPAPPLPVVIIGKVTDSTGAPAEGVSVSILGSNRGTITDPNGNFSIQAMQNATLRFSLIGYMPLERVIKNNEPVNVFLSTADSSMSDVIIVGYGSISKRNITGALSSIPVTAIENQPVASVDQAMAGQAAGIRVSQLTGTPGGGATIRIRGTGSISAGNEPLYVIDGFPFEGGYNRDLNPLATINPNDIESIEVLKDASSVAIYGSRGSNGVVLITTKRGKTGKTSIHFDSYYGIQRVADKIDMLNAQEYALYNTEARNNAWTDMGGHANDPDELRPDRLKIPPMFKNPSSLGKGTDWQDEVFRSAPVHNHQVSVISGNTDTKYMLSAGYFNQQGIVMNTGFERYSLRFNLDSRIARSIKIGLNISPTYSKNDILPVDNQVFSGGILGSALAMPPTVPVYNPDGSYTTQLSTSIYNVGIIDNPVAIAKQIKGGTSAFRTLAGLFAEWEIIDGLSLKCSLGGDLYEDRYSFYWPSTLGRSGTLPPVIPEANASTIRNFVWLNENTITYNRIINKKHAINAVAGITAQQSLADNAYLTAVNFPNDLVTTINAGQITAGGTTRTEWSLFSYLARLNYSFDSRYLLTATVRRDGSSRFGADNKWGTFPSASVGWNISREKFMKFSGIISDLKLRASYGYAGNNAIGDYNFTGLLGSSRYVFGAGTGSVVNGLGPINLSNKFLGWEVMKQADAGIDVGLFRNRIAVIVDYFNKTTSDLLLNVPVPGSTGFSNALQNIGKLSNKGWELTLSTNNTVKKFKWRTDLNISWYKNKVLALGPEGDPIIATSRSFSTQTHITQVGQPIAQFYGYKVIGIYRDQSDIDNSPVVPGISGSRPGDLKFRDNNGDGIISPLDMEVIGSNNPDVSYGITNNFSFENFSLSVLIDGVQGVEVLNGSRRNIGLVNGSYSRRDVLGRWQSPASPGDGKTPRANVIPTGGNVAFVSSLLIEDASFLRIRNINLKYAVPPGILSGASIKHAVVFFSIQNAMTFTKYQGFNPEQSLNGENPLTPGVDFNGYPLARIFSAGLNIVFQ